MSGHRKECPVWQDGECTCALYEEGGYAFCCPVVGMYRCDRPTCRCVENWNAERAREMNSPERQLLKRAREYLAANAAESGADVLIGELTAALAIRLPPIRQEAA